MLPNPWTALCHLLPASSQGWREIRWLFAKTISIFFCPLHCKQKWRQNYQALVPTSSPYAREKKKKKRGEKNPKTPTQSSLSSSWVQVLLTLTPNFTTLLLQKLELNYHCAAQSHSTNCMKPEHLSQLPKAENKWINSPDTAHPQLLVCVYGQLSYREILEALFSFPAQILSQQPSPASCPSGKVPLIRLQP